MGSWNTTCGVTGLPITHGDEVYVFTIFERNPQEYLSWCYTTSLFKPYIAPFVTHYNDYGAGEKSSGIMLPLMLDTLSAVLEEMPKSERSSELAVNKETFNEKVYWNAIHNHRLKVNYIYEKQPVYFTMVIKDIVDVFWNVYDYRISRLENGKHVSKYFTFSQLAEQIPAYVKILLERLKEDDYIGFMTERLFRERDGDPEISNVLSALTFRHYNYDIVRTAEVIRLINENGGSVEIIHAFLECILKGLCVNEMMEIRRQIWLPAQHAGSQDNELDDYIYINDLTYDYVQKKKKEYDDDYE